VKLVFTSRFAKDLRTIRDNSLKSEVNAALDKLKKATRLEEAGDITKLKGSKNAFRLRVGDYRLGFYLENDTIILGRFANRRDIYRLFP
jgi:mRNA interferase RelE/StbE